MNKKVICVVVVAIAVVIGLIVGFSDSSYLRRETASNKLLSSGDLENVSGELSGSGGVENISGDALSGESGEFGSGDLQVSNNDFVPENIRAVYATGWVMGTSSIRKNMIDKIKANDFNAVVIDIKDESGQLSYN